VDGVADLAGVVERAQHVERAFPRDQRLERFARHELHHDEEDVLLLLRREDGDDVGVIQGGQQPRLAQQLAEVDALLMRDLERDFLVDPGVFREVNSPEASAAYRRQDLVLADDLSAEEHPREVYQRECLTPETPTTKDTKDTKDTKEKRLPVAAWSACLQEIRRSGGRSCSALDDQPLPISRG